jgi:spore germination cell wall hydrolase CwlJ-like protein
MKGRTLDRRRRVNPAALAGALTAALISWTPIAVAGNGAATKASSEVMRAMSREQAALKAGAGARLTALAHSTRPLAREDEPVTVASRSAPTAGAGSKAAGKLDGDALDAMGRPSGNAELACLATAIYFESRGEPIAGQVAVAEVILNRVDSRAFPKTVCGVTTQGAGSGGGCQFSYACDGRSDAMTSAGPRARAEKIAALMLAGRARTVTDGATHFHNTSVRPGWSRNLTRTAAIGHHVFYRQGTRVAQR